MPQKTLDKAVKLCNVHDHHRKLSNDDVCRMNMISDCCLTPKQQLLSNIMQEQVNFQWNDDEVRFILDQHA